MNKEVLSELKILDIEVEFLDVTDSRKPYTADVVLSAECGECSDLTLEAVLKDGDGDVVGECAVIEVTGSESRLSGFAEGARIWKLDDPTLHTFEVALKRGGDIIDSREAKLGVRNFAYDRKGFWINGRQVKVRGLNLRKNYPCLQADEYLQKLDVNILKNELGCNSARVADKPPQALIDECDKIGLLIFEYSGNEIRVNGQMVRTADKGKPGKLFKDFCPEGSRQYDCNDIKYTHARSALKITKAMGRGRGAIGGELVDCGGDTGVLDIMRIPKAAAYPFKVMSGAATLETVYRMRRARAGALDVFTNCDNIKLYLDGNYCGTLKPTKCLLTKKISPYITITDFLGDLPWKTEGMSYEAASIFKYYLRGRIRGKKCVVNAALVKTAGFLSRVFSRRTKVQFAELTAKYIGLNNTGTLRIDGYIGDRCAASKTLPGVIETHRIAVMPDTESIAGGSAARVVIEARDVYSNRVCDCFAVVEVADEGGIEITGPSKFALRGGVGAFFVRATGTGGGAVRVVTEYGEEIIKYKL